MSYDLDDMQRMILAALGLHWKLLLAEGLLLIVLGGLAVGLPMVSTLAVTILVGLLLLVGGFIRLIMSFRTRLPASFWWSLLTAALEIAAGMLLLLQPIQGMLTLTVILIGLFILEGIASIVLAIRFRGWTRGWGWTLLSGIVDLLLAALIWAGWPATAGWAIGLLVGINLAFLGVSLVMIALGARATPFPEDDHVPRPFPP